MGQGDSRAEMMALSARLTQSMRHCVAWHQSLCMDDARLCARINEVPENATDQLLVLASQLQSVRAQIAKVAAMIARLQRLRTSAGAVHHQVDLEQAMEAVTRGITQLEGALGHPGRMSRMANEFDEAHMRFRARTETVNDAIDSVGADDEAEAVAALGDGRTANLDVDALARLVANVRSGQDGGAVMAPTVVVAGGAPFPGSQAVAAAGAGAGGRGGMDAAAKAIANALAEARSHAAPAAPPQQHLAAPVPVRRVVVPPPQLLEDDCGGGGDGCGSGATQKGSAGAPRGATEVVDEILLALPSVPRG